MFLVAALMTALPACGERAPHEAATEAAGEIEGIDRSKQGTVAPTTVFQDAAGKDVTIASFKGRPLLINLWATWCAPCVKELPTLNRLAGGSGSIKVIAISQDSGPQPSVAAFLDRLQVPNLEAFHDPAMNLSGATGAQVLPTTILYRADGREQWRYVGDLDWTGAEAAKLLGEAGGGATG